jgi:hypothetical protein
LRVQGERIMKGNEVNIKAHYLFVLCLLSLVLCSTTAFGATIHVPANYGKIQLAINAASDGDIVLVADGTYTDPGNKDIDFKGKQIVVQSENGPKHCIIDCKNNGRGFNFDSGELEDSVVSGFTITNGRTEDEGGAIRCINSSPMIKDCIMADNHVTGNSNNSHGGAIYLGPGACPIITNCVIIRNTSNYYGGGIYSYNARPVITNCTITRNIAIDGGALYCRFKPAPTLTNCILWGNTPNEVAKDLGTEPPKITYSVVQGGHKGTGNVNVVPEFVSSGDYYHLTKDSPCINRGTSTGAPEKDIDGDPRPQGARIDVGADEYTKEQEPKPEEG